MNQQWDDSQLVATWDKAYEEYLKYHKKSTEEVAEVNEMRADKEDGLEKDTDMKDTADASLKGAETSQVFNDDTAVASSGPAHPGPSLDHLDESVRSLVMAWYWAGYYQGLYEGKK
ncbi:hypothetical protein CJU89_1006 [Yarrowia sp. B02]|nr:hypothetical protein CJU89_1006 [Yarrowia sp. B02]